MSLTMSIPVSGNLTNVDGLQLRKNRQNKSVLYFKVAVVEDGRNGGQSKVHYLSCSLNGVMADNLYYAIQQELITTRTRLNLVLGLDTYTKPFNDPSNGNPVDVQQTSYPVWEIGVSARFAPMADVNSPGFQRLMNGQAPQQGGQFQQNQPQAPQQGGQFQQNQPQAPQQGGQFQQNQPQAPQQGGQFQQNQPQAPQQGGQFQQNQPQAPQQGGQFQQNQPQNQAPQQPEQGRTPQPQQGQSMREQPMLDGEDF